MKPSLTLSILLATFLATSIIAQDAPTTEAPTSTTMRIDLETALRLAEADNPTIALARERAKEAKARLRRSQYLLLPTVSGGGSVVNQNGALQDTTGTIRDVNRTSNYYGVGAGAVGAGPLAVPGVAITADLADAIFEPLAARQDHAAMVAASHAMTNNVLLDVASAYFELVRARANLAVAEEASTNIGELARVTGSFAETGEGLRSDAERAQVEKLLLDREFEQAREEVAVRGALLAQLLHLDSHTELEPADANVLALDLVETSSPITTLVAEALENRPEAKQTTAMVKGQQKRLAHAKYGPLIPNVSVGLSYGEFDGDGGPFPTQGGSRTDVSALVFWQLEGLGLGDKERVSENRSRLEQARHLRSSALDAIIAEVRQAHARVTSRQRQLAIVEQAVQTARSSFALNRERIFERQGLPIEVLQAIESLARARRLHVDAVTEYNQAQFQLLTALGR